MEKIKLNLELGNLRAQWDNGEWTIYKDGQMADYFETIDSIEYLKMAAQDLMDNIDIRNTENYRKSAMASPLERMMAGFEAQAI